MQWTPERVEVLTRLWAEGLSARQIAAKLGGVTRNAVIGKAHRLNLQRGAPVPQPPPIPEPVVVRFLNRPPVCEPRAAAFAVVGSVPGRNASRITFLLRSLAN